MIWNPRVCVWAYSNTLERRFLDLGSHIFIKSNLTIVDKLFFCHHSHNNYIDDFLQFVRTDPVQVSHCFIFMKVIALIKQVCRISPKLVTPKISRRKETLSPKSTFAQVPPCTIIFVQESFFFNLTILSQTAPTFQKTLPFDQYFSYSRSNFHVNLVH